MSTPDLPSSAPPAPGTPSVLQIRFARLARLARPWAAPAAVLAALGITLVQAWAYAFRLELSLGPRVVLQPWLIQRGFTMYEQLVDLHSPLMPLALAALRPLVPDGLRLAKLALVALLSLSTLLTFAAAWRTAGRRPLGPAVGLWAAFFFVCFSRPFGFSKLWHESFLAPLYALLLLLPPPARASAAPEARREPAVWVRLALAGLVCGVALLIKQHALFVLGAYVLWTALAAGSWRAALGRCAVLLGVAALPGVAFVVCQWVRAGSLASTLYWVVLFSLSGSYREQSVQAPPLAAFKLVAQAGVLLPAAAVALFDAVRQRRAAAAGERAWAPIAWGFALLAAATVTAYPRFEMFHLQPVVPLMAYLSALALVYAWRAWRQARLFVIAVAVGATLLCTGSVVGPLQIALDSSQLQTIVEYSNLAPLADEVRARIGPRDSVYVYPDDEATSNLYYMLQREPPGYWVFHYSWFMTEAVQGRIVAALAEDQPEWVVYFPSRWVPPAASPLVAAAIQADYVPVATFDWIGNEVQLLRRER